MAHLFDTGYLRLMPDDYKAKWTLLRAIEWARFPLFATQPIIPILIIFYPWKWVAIGIYLATWAWMPVRGSFISLSISQAAATFSHVKFLTCLGAGVFFVLEERWIEAVVATFWPLFAVMFSSLTPSAQYGVLQTAFASELIKKHGPM